MGGTVGERLTEIATKMLEDLRMAPDNPTILYDLICEYQGKFENEKNVCKEVMLAKKKEEYFQSLLDKKKLGIR